MTNRKHLPWLSFDCYDTLIRYSETKALRLQELVKSKGGDNRAITLAQETFKYREREIQRGPFRPLNKVLRASLNDALDAVNLPCSPKDEEAIIEAVCGASPFEDVPDALKELKLNFRLALLSNSEPDIIRHNMLKIGVGMDAIVLASDAKCYKPASGMFETLLSRINEKAANVTHVAQSFYHDIRPAKDKGFRQRIWINRYSREGDPEFAPDYELPTLQELREILMTRCGY